MSGSQTAKRKKVLADEIPAYHDSDPSAKTPVGLDECEILRQGLALTEDEQDWLRAASQVLANQTKAFLEKWRAVIALHCRSVRYCANGQKDRRQFGAVWMSGSPN